ncbi:hypothetical protein RJ641_008752 [Dillenia turbinata]|uniref:Uncharacterized protein n=1 Tax=Dillenia turbinata TaxID=194707 RepID=A0AAN8ZB16_9MAGN
MEVFGKTMVSDPTNVIYLSSILGRDGSIPSHKCDWKCKNEHICGNMYLCKLTGLTHICDKNCNQRILYDNHSSLCRVSGHIFPLTPLEEQAVRGVRRKLDAENSQNDTCIPKRRRDVQFHPSPFEKSFSAGDKLPLNLLEGLEEMLLQNCMAVFAGKFCLSCLCRSLVSKELSLNATSAGLVPYLISCNGEPSSLAGRNESYFSTFLVDPSFGSYSLD